MLIHLKPFPLPSSLHLSSLMVDNMDQKARSLKELSDSCAQETKRYFLGQPHDPRACYELFRRAIVQRDESAWAVIYQQYQPLVASWVRANQSFYHSGEELQYFVNRAFEKMWNYIPARKFRRFSDLNSLLRYLKMCVASAIIDHTRVHSKLQLEELAEASPVNTLDPHGLALEALVIQRSQAEELWQLLKSLASSKKEARLLYGIYVLGLKPREILQSYPEEFKNVQEIYRVKENLLERLSRNQALKEIYASYAGETG